MSDYDLVILSEEIKIYYVHGLIYLLYLVPRLGERPLPQSPLSREYPLPLNLGERHLPQNPLSRERPGKRLLSQLCPAIPPAEGGGIFDEGVMGEGALSQLCPPIVTNDGSDMTLEQLAATNAEFGLFGSSAVVKFDGRKIFELKSDELLVIEQPKEVSSLADHTINWNGEMIMYTKKCDAHHGCLQRAISDLFPKKHLIILRHKKT